MKKLLHDKYFWLIAILVLFLIGAGIYELCKPEPEQPTVGWLMDNCFKTVIERKEDDGTITSHTVNGDPIFHGSYPFVDTREIVDWEVDQTQWKYRVTYYVGYEDQNDMVFLFTKDWFSVNGVPYHLLHMSEFYYQLEGLYEHYNRLAEIMD